MTSYGVVKFSGTFLRFLRSGFARFFVRNPREFNRQAVWKLAVRFSDTLSGFPRAALRVRLAVLRFFVRNPREFNRKAVWKLAVRFSDTLSGFPRAALGVRFLRVSGHRTKGSPFVHSGAAS